MASFNHINGAEPSTVTFKLATVVQTRNSSVMHQEIMALGDPDTSNAIAAVLNTAPASTAWALATREVLPSTGPFAISSIAGVTTIQGNSTVHFPAGMVSSAAPAAGSSALITRLIWSSTNTDQPVAAAQAGTWTVTV